MNDLIFIPISHEIIEKIGGDLFYASQLDDLKSSINVDKEDVIYLDDITVIFGYPLTLEELKQTKGSGLVVIWEVQSGQPIEHIWRGTFSDFPDIVEGDLENHITKEMK